MGLSASSSNDAGPGRWWSRGDLAPAPRPEIDLKQWADPIPVMEQLRDWAEQQAVATISWYQRDKRAKRWASRLLRALAVVLAVSGGVMPLLPAIAHGIDPNLGYVLLALAAGCVAFDHFFGLSTGWMRDIATLQALQSGLARFHLDWVKWQSTVADGPAAAAMPGAVAAALDLIDGLVTGVGRLAEAETAQWIAEFSSSVAALRKQASPSVTSPQDLITWSGREGSLSSG